MLDSPRVDTLKLRFDDNGTELPLGPGMHGIGRGGDDAIGLVIDNQSPLLRFCVDRRGVWLTVADGVRGIHVNGRPVRISSPAEAMRAGIAYVPEDRRRHGVIGEPSSAGNISLASLERV